MPLDPDFAAYTARVTAAVPRVADDSPQARRARMEAVIQRFPYPPDDVARSTHWLSLPGRELMVRLYRPAAGRLPALVYLHGGGWVAGSVDTHDGTAAALARDAGIVVASVQYRRAPENPFPAPNDDAYAALAWLAQRADALGLDAARLAVGGDSAGAHLAIGAALDARARGAPRLVLQVLTYPVIAPDFDTPSYRRHADSPTLTRDEMIAYWRHYLPARSSDPRAVPGTASLAGLPPACILVAGLDPLRDEGVRFAERLEQAGVAVTLLEAPTLAHGFLRAAPYVPEARRMQERMNRAAGAALHGTVDAGAALPMRAGGAS